MGTPLFWWYDFIDANNLYSHYRAFARFTEGEDRRGLAGTMGPLQLAAGNDAGELKARLYRWPTGAYVWIYCNDAMDRIPAPAEQSSYAGVEARIPGLEAGKYRIEYWDCFEGKIIGKEDVQDLPAGQPLKLKPPTFKTSCAIKVHRQ
ncbi:MAG: hypothetical protein ABSE73_31195, partial [Planctomycetota bacterium]